MEDAQHVLQDVDINTVGGGALPDLFADELKLVYADIHNPNKVRESTRTIQLTVQITPDKKGDAIHVICTSTAKLGKREQLGDVMYPHQGKFVRNDLEQLELPGMDSVHKMPEKQAK